MRLFYSDHYAIPLPAGHKFPAAKYGLLRQALEADGFYCFAPAPLADAATIERAHDPAYVRAVMEGTLDARAMRRIGFPWSPELVRRSLASVGGTLAATADALEADSAEIWQAGRTTRFTARGRGSACSTIWRWRSGGAGGGRR